MKQEEMKSGNKSNGIIVEKMSVREWLHANHRRLVKVRFGPQAEMHTVDRKGEKLRSVNFAKCDTITVEESQVTLSAKSIITIFYFDIVKLRPSPRVYKRGH